MKLLAILLCICLSQVALTQTNDRVRITNLDSLIVHTRSLVQREFNNENYPGLAIAVWQQGELIWSEGFGYANLKDSTRVDPGVSLFRIGSVSKTLTAAGLAKLVERKLLDLDAPIQKYVQEFPEKQWPVTTRQVAHHTGGIRHYRGFEFISNKYYPSVNDALQVFKNDTLIFQPGTKYSYSSYGWNLISAAMEGASGRSFIDFMQEEVFIPSGMRNTHPDDVTLSQLPRVAFYDQQGGNNVPSAQVDNSIKWAGGGFLSTAEDLVHFGEAILSYNLITPETQNIFWTTATLPNGNQTNYGLGWTTNADKHDRRWVGHSGGSVGGSTMFLVYPEHQLIVVTLVNRSGANAQELAFTIADQFLK